MGVSTGGAKPGDGGVAGAGGSSGNGGSMALGGDTAQSGATATGGEIAGAGVTADAGGTTGAGGTAGVGGMTGGTITIGGKTAAGGTTASGGAIILGGTTAAGGTTALGGITTVGGSKATGGIATAGGTTAAGGSSAAGGTRVPDGGVDAGPQMYTFTIKLAGNGLGSVSAPSLSCPATSCSQSYLKGATINLLLGPPVNLGSSLSFKFDGWSGGGCTGTGTCQVTLTADTTVTATFSLVCDYYVSVNAGSDSPTAGLSSAQPFRTITYAMSVVPAGKTVCVLPGTYTAPIEAFPIVIPPGMRIYGDLPNRGDGPTPTLVSGTGSTQMLKNQNETATFTSADSNGAVLNGFKLSASPGSGGVSSFLVDAAESTIDLSYNTFAGADGGIHVSSNYLSPSLCPYVSNNTFNTVTYGVQTYCSTSSIYIEKNTFNTPSQPITIRLGSPTIRNNTINGSGTYYGVHVESTSITPVIKNNSFVHSGGYGYGAILSEGGTPQVRGNDFSGLGATMAVQIGYSSVPDLGTAADFGNNIFNNAYVQIMTGWTAKQTIYAIGNTWIPATPVCGTNILPGVGTIVWDAAGTSCP